jgi:hypothetical protein
VEPELDRNAAVERAFWVAAALAAVGGVAPQIVGIGHPNRIGAVLFPFAGATIAMVAVALLYRRGRALSALVYLLGGLAIAYGLLLVLAVPMRLAVTGSCPPAPQACSSAFEMQLTSQEGTGLTIAVALGIMSLLAGYLGLAILYRQQRSPAALPPIWPARPPEKPAAPPPPETTREPEPVPAPIPAPAVVSEPEPAPLPEQALASEPEPPPPPPAEPVPEDVAKPKRKRRPKPPTG